MADLNLKGKKSLSYGASDSDAPLASSTDRGTLEHRDALQRDWTHDDLIKALLAGAISPLQYKVLDVDLVVDALSDFLRDDRPVHDRDKAKAVQSTTNAVSTARLNGVKRLINFLYAS